MKRMLVALALAFGLATVSPHAHAAAAEAAPLAGKRRTAFEAYIADAMNRLGVPGASVAVVENGEVVYLNGFGVKRLGGTQGVTPDTMMMIGSITKSITTMLAAALIDDGRLTWQTRLVDLLPAFSVADRALTERLTIHDAFCNCSGVPGRNIELSFESSNLTPEGVVTALSRTAPAAPFGTQFIYSNILIASGGYALGVANGSGTDDVGRAYDWALHERVLGPIGMAHSTFDTDAVLAGRDYALPHAVNMSGELRPVPLTAEHSLLAYRPAGALWSNAREMARYLQTQLARGVAPDGTRIASAKNLEETWAPGVSVPNYFQGPPQMAATMTRYGLGWMDGEYRGRRIVTHAGGTSGFTASISFLPESHLGIVVLTNSFSLTPVPLAFEYAVQMRLFELLFDQPTEFDAQLMAQAKALKTSHPSPALGKIEPAAVGPYVGSYKNAELGNVSLAMLGERLVLNTGELSSELRPLVSGGGAQTPGYVLHDPPLSLFSEAYGATVRFTGAREQARLIITIPQSVTGPEQEFVFERSPH